MLLAQATNISSCLRAKIFKIKLQIFAQLPARKTDRPSARDEPNGVPPVVFAQWCGRKRRLIGVFVYEIVCVHVLGPANRHLMNASQNAAERARARARKRGAASKSWPRRATSKVSNEVLFNGSLGRERQ